MNKEKLFTKSAFKVALDCPWKLYYYRNPEEYTNANTTDDFLVSLAEGGFQVGELAKIYCGVTDDLRNCKGYDEPVRRTAELMKKENVTIAEAAFRWGNMFVRVDILKKTGNLVELIEVKAKSWNPDTDTFISTRPKGSVKSSIRSYVYDTAYQKYVVSNALPGYQVKAFLMMADKSKSADIDGINQLFKIKRNNEGRIEVIVHPDANKIISESKVQIVNAFDVDDVCNQIISGETTEQKELAVMQGLGFKQFVEKACKCYCDNAPMTEKPFVCGNCFKCEFFDKENPEKSGKRQCWTHYVSIEDFNNRPMMERLNGADLSTKRDKLVQEGTYFLDQIDESMIKPYNEKKADEPGLDGYERKWVQIGLETKKTEILKRFAENINGGTYLDKEGLKEEISTWKYPLHMIDFETTAVALPFYKGLRPYEQVAFQFSHHIISKDGSVEHVGQYLNEDVSKFPNFEFVRELKKQLEKDNGTIFRYADHENNILCGIAKQLAGSDEPDKNELCRFIESITHCNERDNTYCGERDMVDLLKVVKHYFYNVEEMHGSNSIKQVLPAVLNSSDYLKSKYSKKIYGSEIKSKNISSDEPIAWVEIDENGHVDSPYHQLASIGNLIGVDDKMLNLSENESEFTVANGGAALTAYNKLLFCADDSPMSDKLREALLRYCELDTMSMVFIWEYFNDECNK